MATAPAAAQSIPILDLDAQYRGLRSEILNAIEGVLDTQHFILGPNVKALEDSVARLCSVAHGVGVASGTDALILALKAAGVGPGDEVIVPAFSFIATADAVSLLGARPVFADVHADTLNIDVASVGERITGRVKAVIPVHLYGQLADMEAVDALARKHGLTVIEDCAQALGAQGSAGRAAGIGAMGCISFFPSKNLGAYGDGGMVVTGNAEYAEQLRVLRSHGSRKKYYNEIQGWNSRLDELQAAILRVKLPHLESWSSRRRQNAAYYRSLLANEPEITLLTESPDATPVYHQFTVRVPHRDQVQQRMSRAGVQTFVYYPVPLHLQQMYAELGYRAGELPQSEAAAREVLSLPMYPELTHEQMEYVVESLCEAVRECKRECRDERGEQS